MLPIMIMMAIESDEDYSFVETLYNRYEKQMYVIAFSVLHHQQESEDCVHEAVINVIECLGSFRHIDEERKLRRLLAIAARNKAIDLYRRKKRQLEVEAFMAKELEEGLIADSEEDMVRMVINQENRKLVASLVRSLDDIYRDVILLKFEQEMTTKEIAKFLNITDDLVRMRYMRARRLLIAMGGEALYEASKT